MKIEQWPVKRLVPYAKNAKLHSESQVKALARSIEHFGFNNPVLVDAKGVIIAGHGRVLAGQALGLKAIPVIRLGHLTPAQVKAYRLTDNRLSETGGGWDDDLLRMELTELQADGFDLDLTGFDLSDFGGVQGATDPDDVPEAPKNPVTRLGDVWLCGETHRVLCGDATSADDVAKAMGGGQTDAYGHRPALWRGVRRVVA